MGYFQIVERLNVADTKIQIMEKDLEENTLFRIKWPRGEMGSLPADSEQFMMLEDLYKQVDKINKQLDSMMNNRINIEFLRGQMDKVLEDIEELKDKNREMHYQNGEKMVAEIVALLMFIGQILKSIVSSQKVWPNAFAIRGSRRDSLHPMFNTNVCVLKQN